MSQLTTYFHKAAEAKEGVWIIQKRLDVHPFTAELKGISQLAENEKVGNNDEPTHQSINKFKEEFRAEIEEYFDHKVTDNFLTFLIRKEVVPGTQSGVLAFVEEWKGKGVIIAH